MSSDGQGFYITLPSGSSKKLFPENNPSEYTVRLPQWVHLNGHWEIGLHSIAYTPWNIIQPLDEPISFMEGGKEGKGGKMRKHYSSVNEYVSSINRSLKESHVDKSSVDKSSHVPVERRKIHASHFLSRGCRVGSTQEKKRRNANPSPRSRF